MDNLDTFSDILIGIENNNLIVTKAFNKASYYNNLLEYYNVLLDNDKKLENIINILKENKEYNIQNLTKISEFLKYITDNSE